MILNLLRICTPAINTVNCFLKVLKLLVLIIGFWFKDKVLSYLKYVGNLIPCLVLKIESS